MKKFNKYLIVRSNVYQQVGESSNDIQSFFFVIYKELKLMNICPRPFL